MKLQVQTRDRVCKITYESDTQATTAALNDEEPGIIEQFPSATNEALK